MRDEKGGAVSVARWLVVVGAIATLALVADVVLYEQLRDPQSSRTGRARPGATPKGV